MQGVKIILNEAAISSLSAGAERAAEGTMEALRGEVVEAQVMPFDNGDMQDNQTFVEVIRAGNEILAGLTTGAPQARRLYYHPEYNFQTVNNPDAQGLWLKPWISGSKRDFVHDTFVTLCRKETKT